MGRAMWLAPLLFRSCLPKGGYGPAETAVTLHKFWGALSV